MRGSVIGMMLLATAAVSADAAPAKRRAPHRPAAVAAPAPAPAPVVAIEPLPDTPEIQHLRAAFQFAFPVYAMMQTRSVTLGKAQAFGIDGRNRLLPKQKLADASDRDVTTPNNDTLYASAWLDLTAGPLAFELPPLPVRYHSAALMSLFTDDVAIVGTRDGGQGVSYWIVGPGWTGTAPPATKLLRSPTNDAWLLLRVLVDGPADFDAAMAALRQFALNPVAAEAPPPLTAVPTPMPDGATFLNVVNEALGRSPLPPRGKAFEDVGIRPGVTDAWAQLAPEVQALWTRALPAFRVELKGGFAQLAETVDGWSYPGAEIGVFGDNDRSRAAVALGGLAALPTSEAVYLSALADKEGAPLDGSKAYTVHIPGKVPAGAFWSLTMYQQEADGRLFFVDTPAKRFAVGNRTSGLRFERDGSLDIFVQAAKPSGERVVNWLPAPKGPFRLVFRAYRPGPALLDGSFRLPPVVATEAIP